MARKVKTHKKGVTLAFKRIQNTLLYLHGILAGGEIKVVNGMVAIKPANPDNLWEVKSTLDDIVRYPSCCTGRKDLRWKTNIKIDVV